MPKDREKTASKEEANDNEDHKDRPRKSKRKKDESSSSDYDSSDSEDVRHRRSSSGGKKKKRRHSGGSRRSSRDDDDESSPSSDSDSESERSDEGSESDASGSDLEEMRRRRRRKRREREHEKERKKRRKEKEKERKRKREKEEKRKKKKKDKKKDKKKKKEKDVGKKGAVTNSWGKYGIIKETDMWTKRPEFTAWLAEVKQVNLETLPNWEEKQMFKEFMEDHNTATFPSKKYYGLDAYYRHKMEKEMKKGLKKVATERTVFNDEEQRRLELMRERERHKEEQVEALKRSMQSGMAQEMKEQARLREEMAYQYKLGNFEAAAAIQKRLDPDVAM